MALSLSLIPTLLLLGGASDPLRVARLVTVATSVSALIEVAIQLPRATRRMRYRPLFRPSDPRLQRTLLLAVPAVIARPERRNSTSCFRKT